MTNPDLLDALRSRFELQGMSIGRLPETIESDLIEAASILTDTLIQDNKIHVIGFKDSRQTAAIMAEELTNSSNIDRPALPCLLITHQDLETQKRYIQTIVSSGDSIVILQDSKTSNIEMITNLAELALSLELKVIVIGSNSQVMQDHINKTYINLDSQSRMDYLSAMPVITMTLVALVDHHLFQQVL